jgi:hypothetical protein
MTLTEDASGVYILSATPFAEDGAIDWASADRLVEFYLSKGVTGMTILGMMGEAPKLSSDDSLAFMSHMLGRVAGRVPVIVGVSNAGVANAAARRRPCHPKRDFAPPWRAQLQRGPRAGAKDQRGGWGRDYAADRAPERALEGTGV